MNNHLLPQETEEFLRNLEKNQQSKGKNIYLKSSGGELNSDSGFGLQTELVSSEPGEDVGFAYT